MKVRETIICLLEISAANICLWNAACERDPQFRFDLYDHSCKSLEVQEFTSPASTGTPHTQSKPIQRDRTFAIPHARQNSFNSSQSAPSPRSLLPPSSLPYGAPLPSPSLPNGYPPPNPVMSPTSVASQYGTAQRHSGYENQGQHGYQINAGSLPTPVSQVHCLNSTLR